MTERLVGIFVFYWILTRKQNSLHNNMRYKMGKKNKNEKVNNDVVKTAVEPSVTPNNEQSVLDTLNEIKSILNAMQVSMAKIAGRY